MDGRGCSRAALDSAVEDVADDRGKTMTGTYCNRHPVHAVELVAGRAISSDDKDGLLEGNMLSEELGQNALQFVLDALRTAK